MLFQSLMGPAPGITGAAVSSASPLPNSADAQLAELFVPGAAYKNTSARTAGGASTRAYHQRRLGVFFMEWYWHFILGEPEFLQLRYARYTQLPRRGGGVLSMTRYT